MKFRRGSILLEAVLSLLFISLMVGAVAGLFRNSMAKVRQAEFKTRAMLLAETKLAELQTGMIDITEGNSGDFDGKPANFTWQIDEEDIQTTNSTDTSTSETTEVKRLKLTITYTDENDGFSYSIYRLYSPTLNMSAEKIKAISNDPTQIQSLSSSSASMQELIEMLGEFTGGDQLLNALLKGGVPAMMALYSKVISGKISTDDLLAMLEETQSSSGSSRLVSTATEGNSETSGGVPWTDYDTAGTGSKPTTQSSLTELADSNEQTNPTTQASNTTGENTDTSTSETTGRDTSTTSTGSMTRDEAIKKMQEMLRRLANKKK
jgi:type II secretory pathway pseudopilin PulG